VTVLVTGGSGLVGSHVIAALRARGEEVRALARARAAPAVREAVRRTVRWVVANEKPGS
jgi:uncharacterized protein YbjT (DUF2867 family)